MQLLNARHSRAVLTAASEGATVAAAEQVPGISRCLAQEHCLSLPKVLEALGDSQLHQHNLSTCFQNMACARTPVIRV